MGLLEKIESGISNVPPRIIIYGGEGVGKSTMASKFPNPVFIQTEDGLNQIDCNKLPLCKSFDEVMENIYAIANEEHNFKTLVIDGISSLEPLVWDYICTKFGSPSIEKVDGGYGKGYNYAVDSWRNFIKGLNNVHDKRKMNIVLIAHQGIEQINDPEQEQMYNKTSLKMNAKAAAVVTQWADAVLHVRSEFRVRKIESGLKVKTVATPIGNEMERYFRCVGGVSVTAKNRFGMPATIPFDYNELKKYINIAE